MRALPPRALQDLASLLAELEDGSTSEMAREASRLLAYVRQALKPKRALAPAKQRRQQKKLAQREEIMAIREAVMARAKGLCEMCDATATDLEHAFGRVQVPQKVSNCLALCRQCHADRTNSRPSAAHWWLRYAFHFGKHGYFDEARRANDLAMKHAPNGIRLVERA